MVGLGIDIHSKGKWPSCVLSNFYPNSFVFDGTICCSMEGFIQSLKCNNRNEQLRVCKMKGKEAKNFGQKVKHNPNYDIEERDICWNGKLINRHSDDYQIFLRRVYHTMSEQCPEFREALKSTGTKRLYHTIGNPDSHSTILTENELCDILTELRKGL